MANSLYDYIILKVKYLPTKYSSDFEDRKYIKDIRVLKKYYETDREPVYTENYFKTTLNRNESRRVLLQSYNVDTYEIEIDFKENINLSDIQNAEKLTLVDENGEPGQQIIFISADIENVSDTTLQKAIFKFSKRLNDTDCVNNFVTSELLNDKFSGRINYLELSNNKNINSFDFAGGEKKYFYTIFFPYIVRPKDVKQIEKTDGKILNVNVKNYQEVNFKLFLTENEYNDFAKYADACYYKDTSGNDKGVRFVTDETAYQSAQNLEWEPVFNEELIDLIEINCKIKLDFINYYNY